MNQKKKVRAESPRNRIKYINGRLKEIREERARLVEERKVLREKTRPEKSAEAKASQ